jgi:hypothetical protein
MIFRTDPIGLSGTTIRYRPAELRLKERASQNRVTDQSSKLDRICASRPVRPIGSTFLCKFMATLS